MAKPEPLEVWLEGIHVATLSTTGRAGAVSCRYTAAALERWPLNTPLLSCALLTSDRKLDAARFFRGLLPEGDHLQALAQRAGVASYDTFALLRRFGRDVAGALVITTDSDAVDRRGAVEEYSDDTLAEEVASLPENPLGVHDDSELSIAGLQDKLLLVDLGDGRWGRPVHGRPSTHILKVEARRYPGMADLEAGCLRLAAATGLTDIRASTATYADVACLIVSRFDREVVSDGTVVRRIHQEDACQALNVDIEANNRRGKYEDAGGPSFAKVAGLLDVYANDAVAELTKLVQVAAFTIAIGNADAHGKNLALLHDMSGTVRLAPLYDLVPTLLWPNLRTAAAMTVAGRIPSDLRDASVFGVGVLCDEARRWPLDRTLAERAARELLDRLEAAVATVDIPEQLADLARSRVQQMLAR